MKKALIIIASIILVITALITGVVMNKKVKWQNALENGKQYIASIPEDAYLDAEELKKVVSILCSKDQNAKIRIIDSDLILEDGENYDYQFYDTVIEKKVSGDGTVIKKNMPENSIALGVTIYDYSPKKKDLLYLTYAFDTWLFLKDKKTDNDIFALVMWYSYLGLAGIDAGGGIAGIVSKLDFEYIYDLEYDSGLSRGENAEKMAASWMRLSQVEKYRNEARIIEP